MTYMCSDGLCSLYRIYTCNMDVYYYGTIESKFNYIFVAFFALSLYLVLCRYIFVQVFRLLL